MAIDPGTTPPPAGDTPVRTAVEMPPYEDVVAQLDDPRAILGNALWRVHRADDIQATLGGLAPEGQEGDWQQLTDLREQLNHQLETAELLTGIATAAYAMMPQFIAAELDAASGHSGYWRPQPVNGMIFVAAFKARFMGRHGGREWAFIQHGGGRFLDVTHAQHVGTGVDTDEHGEVDVRFAGRVVSATPHEILGITEYGDSVTLPRTLCDESADDGS